MKKLRAFLRRIRWLWNLPDHYAADIGDIRKYVSEHVTVHADIHMKAPNIIIAVGRYRRRDYVRIFEIDDQDFSSLVEHLRKMEPHSKLGRIDAMHGISPMIRAVWERDRNV